MKKICLFLTAILLTCICLTGCGKYGEEDLLKDLDTKITKTKAYQLEGKLEIVNNDDVYNYTVITSYQKDNNYKMSLKNNANNHEQIILKNDTAVYVLTPSLNKSFKFQSDWPYNNSQIYLLESILEDLQNDKERTFREKKDTYVLTSNVNYPSNRKLKKQEVTIDKDLNLKTVKVFDDNNIPLMTMQFSKIDWKPKFKDDYFTLEDAMKTTSQEEEVRTTSVIEDVIYPLVIPEGTQLTGEDRVTKADGERVILTFEGEKPFLLVEETVNKEEELTVIPTYGEPFQFMDTVGALSTNSLSWIANGMEYYLVSDVLNQDELVEVAESISVIPTMK